MARRLNGIVPYGPLLRENRYLVPAADANAMGVGTMVKAHGTPNTAGTYAGATLAGAEYYMLGPITRVEADPDNPGRKYRVASTAWYVYVADHPDQEFMAIEDGVGGAIAAASVNLNVGPTAEVFDTTNQVSTQKIDSSTAATTADAAHPLRLRRLLDEPGVEAGDVNKSVWIFTILNHALGYTTGV